MTEDTPTCRIHEKHEFINCKNPALEGEPDGYCILHSQNQEKDPEVFRRALLSRWTQVDTEFYNFHGVFFPGPFDPEEFFGFREFAKPVDFSEATFAQRANFSGATFKERAGFSGATFKKEAIFSEAFFAKGAYFLGANFSEEANFFGVTFKEWASFSGAIFREGAAFSRATFTRDALFIGAKIFGRVVFQAFNPSEEGKPPPPDFQGDFRDLELTPGALLRFQDLSLAHVEFTGTDLRWIEFHNITWLSYSNWFFRKDVKWLPIRQAVYDEVLLDEKEPSLFYRAKNNLINIALFWKWPFIKISKPNKAEYARVEELYRYLRINYEDKGDYKNAGDFHYGEMEMHRRASPWRRWVFFSWYNLYRSLSGYGERPLWALMWLMAFLFGFSGFVWWLGLSVDDYGNTSSLWDSIVYILQKASLQRPAWPKPSGFGARFWSSLSVLLIPGQAALFLLALRNRLGRRR